MLDFHALLMLLGSALVPMIAAQYENYSFKKFPPEELMPLTTAYELALDHYAAENWTGSIRYLELSLRLRRVLQDSSRFCSLRCESSRTEEPTFTEDLRFSWRLTMMASCLRRCRVHLPALQLAPPSRGILEDFSRRSPYRYLHHAHAKLGDLQSAVPCAYTFLQKNPEDQEMKRLMKEYGEQYDLSGFLIDREAQQHEAPFLRGVKLISAGNYSGGVENMEEALRLYLQEFDLCQVDCEGIIDTASCDSDFYAIMADTIVDIFQCKLKCEENLMPSVGGFLVEKFMATIYHHLQYAYYRLNEGQRAVACAYSYFLFEPEDQVMEQNLQYYKANGKQWGLQPEHLTARTEALRHHNHTSALRQMLTSAGKYSKMSDKDFFGPEEAARFAPESPDAEFEGIGDYEESIYSDWKQPQGKGDAGE